MTANGAILNDEPAHNVAGPWGSLLIHPDHNGAPPPDTQPLRRQPVSRPILAAYCHALRATSHGDRASRDPVRVTALRAGSPFPAYPGSFFFSSSFSCAGFAFPPVAFMTWPTKNPNSLSLPARYSASCAGLRAITSS